MENPTEWGRLNAGQRYNVLALDIDRALAFAKLGFYEGILFEQARELSWHQAVRAKRGRDEQWPEAKPARLNLYALAKKLRLERRRFFEAKGWLLAARMFLPSGDRRDVLINKRADEWVDPANGRPRLRAEWVEFCLEARPRSQSILPLSMPFDEGAEPPQHEGAKAPSNQGARPPLLGAQNRTQQGRDGALIHIEERAGGDLKKSFKSVCETRTHTRDGLFGGGSDEDDNLDWLEDYAKNGSHR